MATHSGDIQNGQAATDEATKSQATNSDTDNTANRSRQSKGIEAVTVGDDAAHTAKLAAAWVSSFLTTTITERGSASFAVSGGSSPAAMLKALASFEIDWKHVHLLQVDERLAPKGGPDRNLSQLQKCLLDHIDIPITNVHPMPVDDAMTALTAMTPDTRAYEYERVLANVAPDGIDLVHLGLGSDGHTASLLPGDPGLLVSDRAVAFTGLYKGFRRLTLTYPELVKAHAIVWLISGADKSVPLKQLLSGDTTIPGGRISNHHQTIFCDPLAADDSTKSGFITPVQKPRPAKM